MSRENSAFLYDESRIYEEDGEVKVRHIIHDCPITDMTPHPTETRVFIKDGEATTILSEETEQKGFMSPELMEAILLEETKVDYDYYRIPKLK